MKKKLVVVLILIFIFLICQSVLADTYKAPTNPVNRAYPGVLLWPLKDYKKPNSWPQWRFHPIKKVNRPHHGADIATGRDTPPIMAAADGVAYRYSSSTGLGNYVIIDHGNGFYTAYGHMSRHATAKGEVFEGKKSVDVKAGDIIGYVGTTGTSTGNHLHFEIAYCWNGSGKASKYTSDTWAKNWGGNGWEILDSKNTIQTYTYDKNDPRLQKYPLTNEGRYYSKALSTVSYYKFPYNDSSIEKTDPSGYGIITVGKYIDKKTNQVWFKTEKGYWVKSEQITTPINFPSQMASGNETKETKIPFPVIVKPAWNVYLESEPYSTYVNESNNKGMIPAKEGDELTVKYLWKNKHGNYWLEFTNGLFLCANNVTKNKSEKINDGKQEDVWFDKPDVYPILPKNDLVLKKSFDLEGTLRCAYGIKEVTGAVCLPISPYPVYDKQFAVTLSYKTPIESLSLYWSKINLSKEGGISFGNLPKGVYTFRLTVKYDKLIWRDITNPKTEPYISVPQEKVFSSDFTVGMGKASEAALSSIVHEVKVTSISLNESSKTMSIGEIFSLTETLVPSNPTNPKVSWSSSDPTVAVVENGKVTAKGKGTTTITATTEDGSQKTASCAVTVLKLPESVSVSGGHTVFENDNTNNTVQLTATVLPADASDTTVTWKSSNDSIATVSNSGLVTSHGAGIATITATANGNPSLVASSQIEVKSYVTGLSITGNDEVAVGGNSHYKATVSPSTASDQTIIWATSNENVATVLNGVVYGQGQGTVTITATAADRNTVVAQKEISIYQPIKEISLSGTNALTVGNTATLTAHVLPSNANINKITWSTDNDSIAKVDQNGEVTAKGNGIVTVSAMASDDPSVCATHEIEVTTLVSSLSLAEIESVDVGASASYEATISPVTASNKKLIWSVDDETLASIDSSGRITGLAPGYVSVTATTTDGSGISETVELEIIQKVQKISVDVPPVAYCGDVVEPYVIVLPDNASYRDVTWSSSNSDIIRIVEYNIEEGYTDADDWYTFECVGAGTVRLTATATDGSNVSGSAYIQVRNNVELQRHTMTFDLLATGNGKDYLGRVSMTADCAARAAEAGYGAIWSIEHISGDYAAKIGISEQNSAYGGFAVADAAAINLLRVDHAGSDVYRVTCTINGYTDTCTVTVNVAEPESPLPESVTLSNSTFYGQVNDTVTVSAIPVCEPAGSALPEEVNKYMYGVDAFNRYAVVAYDGNNINVRFTKAGTYTARVQFSGANYQYDTYISFVITNPGGTIPAEVEGLDFDDSVSYLLAGETSQLIVNIQPANADETALTWSSSDTSVATVDQNGNVTAINYGTAVITVSADNGITAKALIYVTDSLLSIDWNADNIIRVYLDGSTKTTVQKVFLTPRASASLSSAPSWSIKRLEGNNLTLTCNPIVSTGENGENLYGCEIILKSASSFGLTEYELSCTDGIHEASTRIKVEAFNTGNEVPSLISWENSTFTGNVNQLMTIHPNVVCWPDGTTLPDAVMVSFEGDPYWNEAINVSDYTISRNMMTFSFSEPGIYTANCIYACSNMRYLVPVTFRIQDSGGNIPVRVNRVSLNANEISIEANDNFQLNAFITPDDATNKAVVWSVEDSGIASVSNNGLVTGVANGRTIVWCTPSDPSCDPVKCVVVVEDAFTVIQTEEMSYQYLQGETGNAAAGFSLSKGTAKRIEAEGVTPTWNLTRVSGNAADVVLQENNGVMYIVVTDLKKAGTDTYNVSCNAGNHTWSGSATLEVAGAGSNVPASVTIATTQYTANVNEEIELDFTPVCQPSSASIPSELRASYIGIGDFYQGLVDSYRTSVLTARNDTVRVAFKKPGKYILSRVYRSCNLNFVTESTITVGNGEVNLLKCTDPEPVVYIGGKSGIASTCILSDISVEELYGADLVWSAERISGDCLTVALRADQSSASLYVVNAKEAGSECWRVSCTFHNITSYMDITIQATEPRTALPESVSLYQTEFEGMTGRYIPVPLATACSPAEASLPETSADAWTFVTDGYGTDHAEWIIADDQMKICFTESGYYGGRLVYESGNVKYEFPIYFAIVDEESTQNVPAHLDILLDNDSVTVYPEGDLGVNIVRAALSDSLDEYSLSSVASYAELTGAVWSIEITDGNACALTINQINAASVQIKLASISGYGDVSYALHCAIAGNTYTVSGTVHVASGNEPRPQAKLKKNYYTTQVGTVLTIDASFYDRTTSAKLCDGRNSIWENQSALAAMGFEYNTAEDSWVPVFYEEGTYTTTVAAWIGNFKLEEELTVCVYREKPLPGNPSTITIPGALLTIEDEAFSGVPVNIIDLRGANVRTIGQKAFAGCTGLMKIYIPGSVTSIAGNAFEGCIGFVICCDEGSAADTFARDHGIPALHNDN